MAGTWYLDNVEDRAREAPRTFFIPPEQRRHNLQEGDTVKLVFMLNHPSGDQPEAERMWVDVISADGTSYTGSLLNTPHTIRDLKPGDKVAFGPEHVAAVAVNEAEIGYAVQQRALVSRRLAAKDVRPGLLSRDEPVEERDSGWTLMLGDEPQSFYEEAENFGMTDLGFLTDKFPELERVFREGSPGDQWRWDEQAGEYRRTNTDQT